MQNKKLFYPGHWRVWEMLITQTVKSLHVLLSLENQLLKEIIIHVKR